MIIWNSLSAWIAVNKRTLRTRGRRLPASQWARGRGQEDGCAHRGRRLRASQWARGSEQEAVDNKLLEQEIPFVVGTCFMHVRKDQVVPGSRRGGSCARPRILRTTILGICADMYKASTANQASLAIWTPPKITLLAEPQNHPLWRWINAPYPL